ncbi:hypothetical protein ANCCEY_10063 [Ancylostoma ceylanicum]|uniref:Uncharacterized protein n=2 Tax=Ancylostoma ceylanicum TaxID=53326 RepID=A0A0D6LT96_9BILA|nr:hypothetical protein ANCCEY_10063 [Ancylostoma ceylanicum]EYC39708.1 hypothetical protein Y032_0643g1049 [Ancylostoma ceylanicum]
MKRLFIFLTLLAVVDVAFSVTCASMNVPGLKTAARVACIASCSGQNCGTGYCEKRGRQKICVCSRCKVGGNFPLDSLIGLLGKKGK